MDWLIVVAILGIWICLLSLLFKQRSRMVRFLGGVLLIGVPVTGVIGFLWLTRPRPPRHVECMNNLKQISLALYNYHEAHGRLPPAYILGPDGKRWHSWRTLILPFLDQPKLYKQYRFDEPWDGEHNRTLWSQVRGLRCLHDRANFEQRGLTHFVAVVGPKTAWPGENATSLKNFWDGSANTIMVVEVNQPVPWFAPMDLEFDDALQHWGDGQESQSRHGGGRLVAFADGSLRWLPSTGEQKINKEIWGAMLTRSGRETVKLP